MQKVLKHTVVKALSTAIATLFLLVMVSGAVLAQTETGQITVKVTDPNGAVVPGANVIVRSVNTGAERTGTTNDGGEYTVTNLQPSLYDVIVKSGQFAENTQRVQLTVGAKSSVESKLSVTAQTANVTVTAEGGIEINTQTSELSNVISGTQIRELPTLTRDPYTLIGISGNVSGVDANDAQGGVTSRGVGASINGQRAASTSILLDGGENVDNFTASVGQSVPLDSVQEFRVITNNFSAEYGRASGGIVNVATRSGTNEFHGTAYEFYRGSRFASNDFNSNAQGLKKPVFVRNQFGYSIGGPVILPHFGEGGRSTINLKGKLFFFSSTEWTRVRSSANVINVVPTPQLLAASDPRTQAFFSAFPLAFPISGTIYTAGQVDDSLGLTPDPASSNLFARLPVNTPVFGQVKYTVPANSGGGDPQNSYSTVNRADWNLSDKTQIYFRYARENQLLFPGTVSLSPYSGFNTGNTDLNNNFLLSLTHTFSPRFVSATKLVFNRLNNFQPLGEQPVVPTLYLTGTAHQKIQGFDVAFPGYLPFTPGNGIPFGGPQNLGQVYQDMSYSTGKHQLKFGGSFIYIQDNRSFGAYEEATVQLGSNSPGGLNNFIAGQARLFQAAVFPQGKFPGDTLNLPVGPPAFTRSNRYKDWAAYVNDSYRVGKRLILNLGVRYEYYGVQHNKDPKLESNFVFGTGSSIQERIRNGKVFTVPNSPVGGLWKPDKNNFAPRVGFAWDVFGDGKTSIRGGYGIAYERNFGNVTFNVIQNPPNYLVVSLLAGTDVPSIPISLSNAGPLAGSSGTKVIPIGSLRHVREDIQTAYSHLYSFSFEHEVSPGVVASVEYSGSTGRKLYSIENLNRSGFGPRYLGSNVARPPAIGGTVSRLNGQYGNINSRGNGGFSRYNALIASLETANFRKLGLGFTARYTLAQSKDNLSSTFSESNNSFNLGLLDPFDPKLDYGYADFDVRHRFSSSFNWEIPYAKNYNGVAKQILDGWSITGTFEARTGTPFTVFDCENQITVCVRLVPTGPVSFKHSGSLKPDPSIPNRFVYIDLSNQTKGLISDVSGGNEAGPYPANMTRRNAFRGPGFWDTTLGVFKSVKLTEKTKIQLRGEFFNVFNHANLFVSGSEADISQGPFVPASRFGRRNIQLAAKFIF